MTKTYVGAVLILWMLIFFSGCSRADSENTIKVPGGRTVDVVFEGPAELEMTFQELGVKNFGFYIDGTLHNTSDKTDIIIGPGGLGFFVDGVQQATWNPLVEQRINPGESVRVQKGFGDLITTARHVVIKVTDYRTISSTSVSSPVASRTSETARKVTATESGIAAKQTAQNQGASFKGPPQLKMTSVEVTVTGVGPVYRVKAVGTVENTSATTSVAFSKISLSAGGDRCGWWSAPGNEYVLQPGQSVQIETERSETFKNNGFVLSVEPFYRLEIPYSIELVTYPQNPVNAEELMVAFFLLCSDERYAEAEQLVEPDILPYWQAVGGVEGEFIANGWGGKEIRRIEFILTIAYNAGYERTMAEDGVMMYFSDGSVGNFKTLYMKNTTDGWRIASDRPTMK